MPRSELVVRPALASRAIGSGARFAFWLWPLFAMLACVGGGDDSLPELVDGEALTLLSDGGLARVHVESATDDPIVQGRGTLIVDLSPLAGQRASLESVRTFMPAHGHGSSTPVVSERGGSFRVEELNLFMNGLWDVYLDLKVDGADDGAAFVIRVE
jgi:hypothetical protein